MEREREREWGLGLGARGWVQTKEHIPYIRIAL
jgi:hypothetical protein